MTTVSTDASFSSWTSLFNLSAVNIEVHLDVGATTKLEDELNKWITRGETHFVFDLEKLEYMSSAGLRYSGKIRDFHSTTGIKLSSFL